MSDDRPTSASDDLLDQARSDAAGDAPQIDDYEVSTQLDRSESFDGPDIDYEGLSASDIADELLADSAEATEDFGDTAAETASIPAPSSPTRPSSFSEPVPVPHDMDAGDLAGQYELDDAPSPIPPSDPWATPTAEWEAYAATQAEKKKPRFSGRMPPVKLLVVLIPLAIFGFGFVAAFLSGTQPIQDTDIGDCFIVGDALEIDSVRVVECSEAHDSEVFALIEATNFGAEYPGEDPLFEWLFEECVVRFPDYVGEPFESSSYWLDTLIPTPEGWQEGDHVGMCTIVIFDEEFNLQTSVGSARNSANNA